MGQEQAKTRSFDGEGSIRQRSDGRWEFRIKDKMFNGGKPISLYGTSKKDIKKKVREFHQTRNEKLSGALTIEATQQYMDNWFHTVKVKSLKPSSADRLESTLISHVYPAIGWIPLSVVSTDDIQGLVDGMYKKGYSQSSVKKVLQAINNCFTHALRKYPSPITHNPCMGVTLKDARYVESSKPTYFTEDEVRRLIDTATRVTQRKDGKSSVSYRLGWTVVLLLNTGLRVGELLALKWEENIDFEAGTISVTNNVVKVKDRGRGAKGQYVLIDQKSTKTKAGARTLSMNSAARSALNELYAVTGEYTYVVSTKGGLPKSPYDMAKMFRAICDQAEIKRVNGKIYGLHSLRHTFASSLFANGVDVKIVSEILGHANVQITYDIYIHLLQEHKRKAFEVVDII